MAREIKFRFWSIDNKQMLSSDQINSNHAYRYLTNKNDQRSYIIPMQFTGLHDKNGKEIYEGDIVGSGTGEILWCDLECMFKVKWHGEVFKRIRGQNDKYTLNGEPLFMNAHITWEIIGNIYETPELLTPNTK